MRGYNHAVCSSAMFVSACVFHHTCTKINSGEMSYFWNIDMSKLHTITKIDSEIWKFLGFEQISNLESMMKLVCMFFIFIIGTFCTDCDSKTSMMGRILHIPFEHKTWLHAIWVPLLCLFAGMSFPPASWFALGWLSHEFMDSFSYCGVAYLYPFTSYKKCGFGKQKRGLHIFKCYYVGKQSETIFVCVVGLINVLFLLFLFLGNYFAITFTNGQIIITTI